MLLFQRKKIALFPLFFFFFFLIDIQKRDYDHFIVYDVFGKIIDLGFLKQERKKIWKHHNKSDNFI